MPILTGTYTDSLFYVTRQPLKNLHLVAIDMCYKCYNTSLMVCTKETMKRCKCCGYESEIAGIEYQAKTASDIISTGEKKQHNFPRQVSTNIYKRCNHFKYWLKRIQGKEKNKITKEDLAVITQEIRSQHISEDYLNYHQIRSVLKKLKLQKYYINTFSIQRYITGEWILELTLAQEKVLLDMFVQIQESFQENSLGRVNMLSYTFILTKFCEILEWNDMATIIPSLKTRSKLYKQDQVWKEICNTLGWKFIRSVL